MVSSNDIPEVIASTLWDVARYSGFPETQGRPLYVPNAFKSKFVEALPIPIGENRHPDQPVTLMAEHDFDRSAKTTSAIARAYTEYPRTRVYENLAKVNEGWIRSVCQILGGWSRRLVTCSAFESNTSDAAIHPHYDEWAGIAMPISGAKDWELETQAGVQRVRTLPGSLLFISPDTRHAVSTPEDPGYSLHLSFGFHAKFAIREDGVLAPSD